MGTERKIKEMRRLSDLTRKCRRGTKAKGQSGYEKIFELRRTHKKEEPTTSDLATHEKDQREAGEEEFSQHSSDRE